MCIFLCAEGLPMYFHAVPTSPGGEPAPRSGEFVRLLGLLLLVFAVLGCNKARIGDPSPEALGDDTDLAPDAAPASPDALVAPQADAALPPAPVDAALPDATPAAATCMELYGLAPEYQLCSETPDYCAFNAKTDGGNCQEMCALYGGTCLAAYDNNDSDVCISEGEDTCLTNRRNEICVCSRPQ